MSKYLFNILALLLGLVISLSASAQESGPGRAQLDHFSAGLDSLHAYFDQRVLSGDGKEQDASSGEFWLMRPQLFRWAYGGDFPELVVADGKRIWIYDEMLEQVTVKDQSMALVDSPLTLLTNPARLDEQFEVREVGETEEMTLVELKSRSADTQFDRILLGLADDVLSLMVMEDAFGLRTELRFSRIERNPELETSLFTFEPPANADVIGEFGAAEN